VNKGKFNMLETVTETKPKIAYSVQEAAQETSLSVPYLRNEIRDGNLKATRRGVRVLILHDDLIDYLKKGYENN
jgi:excisionase family DNA binding protein